MIKQPKISIVTPSYNQGQYIEETIVSVLEQNYPNLEYIIIDGGSTDASLSVIKKYAGHLKHWRSEQDRGQVDAINKGLHFCTGEIFNWLNADDFLTPGALHKIAAAFNDNADLVAGKVNNFDSKESTIVFNQHLSATGLLRWEPGVQFVQPGVWMKRQHFIDCGGLDEQFHYAFDWDMLIRYLYHFPSVKYLDEVLVNFRLHDHSKTMSAANKFAEEERLIIEKLAKDPNLGQIHAACQWKIERSKWTKFLTETSQSTNSKIARMLTIIKKLHRQPADLKVTRMTLGAIKEIIRS